MCLKNFSKFLPDYCKLVSERGIVYFYFLFVLIFVTFLSKEDSLDNKVIINFISVFEVCCRCVVGPCCIIFKFGVIV
jgi:hypothetical protein